MPQLLIRGRKGNTKKLCDKDFADLSSELSGAICLKTLCFSGESNRPLIPILLTSIAIHLPFLARCFCKSMPSLWQKVEYTPPTCITIRLPFVSRYFCRSIRVRGCWNTPEFYWEMPPKCSDSSSGAVCLCDFLAL